MVEKQQMVQGYRAKGYCPSHYLSLIQSPGFSWIEKHCLPLTNQ